MANKYKHAFVGADQQGDACIYVLWIDQEGNTGKYLSAKMLQKIADHINRTDFGLLRKQEKG